jgi:hypothetical protein
VTTVAHISKHRDINAKKDKAPTWTGKGALLSTAVSRVLVPGTISGGGPVAWKLKHGQQCWIEKSGGEIWVCTTKEQNSGAQLRVKLNRCSETGKSCGRDKDSTFEAEEVVVLGTLDVYYSGFLVCEGAVSKYRD